MENHSSFIGGQMPFLTQIGEPGEHFGIIGGVQENPFGAGQKPQSQPGFRGVFGIARPQIFLIKMGVVLQRQGRSHMELFAKALPDLLGDGPESVGGIFHRNQMNMKVWPTHETKTEEQSDFRRPGGSTDEHMTQVDVFLFGLEKQLLGGCHIAPTTGSPRI